jgi:LPXTG-site transpeptidase (sortase) family protein
MSLRRLLVASVVVAAVAVGGWSSVDRPGEPTRDRDDAADASALAGSERRPPTTRRAPDVSRSQDLGTPRGIEIPSLGVDAPVVPKSADDSTFEAPGDARVVGWWADGAQPGDRRGSALLAGHTLRGDRGALHDLEKVSIGDRISVSTVDGVVRYRVREVEVLTKRQVAARAEQLFDQSVAGRLVVVTCELWDGRRFTGNAVVTADPVRVLSRSA